MRGIEKILNVGPGPSPRAHRERPARFAWASGLTDLDLSCTRGVEVSGELVIQGVFHRLGVGRVAGDLGEEMASFA